MTLTERFGKKRGRFFISQNSRNFRVFKLCFNSQRHFGCPGFRSSCLNINFILTEFHLKEPGEKVVVSWLSKSGSTLDKNRVWVNCPVGVYLYPGICGHSERLLFMWHLFSPFTHNLNEHWSCPRLYKYIRLKISKFSWLSR